MSQQAERWDLYPTTSNRYPFNKLLKCMAASHRIPLF
ncbi:hypothetical protein M7I_5085 [Glarea lozoyensis 74030]|uniref:Uncharacterized protein n=1 Tax=Glarea lozoyensis (strain ATCC 74030 / MF5533) TaxID=1104152 RepID=H0EQX6_GLAL7|nr:hypothetical protein M7I_5085 [Glarea lozoyensis 74030]